MPSLRCCADFFSHCGEQGLLFSCDTQASHCCGLFCRRTWALGQANFIFEGTWTQYLWLLVSGAQAHGLSCYRCSEACEILPEQGANRVSCLNFQVDSLWQGCQKSPRGPSWVALQKLKCGWKGLIMNNNSFSSKHYHLVNYKSFRSSCWTRDETRYMYLLYHNIIVTGVC